MSLNEVIVGIGPRRWNDLRKPAVYKRRNDVTGRLLGNCYYFSNRLNGKYANMIEPCVFCRVTVAGGVAANEWRL